MSYQAVSRQEAINRTDCYRAGHCWSLLVMTLDLLFAVRVPRSIRSAESDRNPFIVAVRPGATGSDRGQCANDGTPEYFSTVSLWELLRGFFTP